eukprot:GHVR01192875.1.p1 GENE.GHVR01192875.1~~GHVR01192875.1.p1  ORF type:complete len:152 (-),score=51.36 GHVR01192875.1:864-1319(-)
MYEYESQSQMGVPPGMNVPDIMSYAGRINLNTLEMPYFANLFGILEADSGLAGYVSAEVAASFLRKSGLKQEVLHEIWNVSDYGHKGRLSVEDFCVACRLVALAQGGVPPSENAIRMDANMLPTFDRITHSNTQVCRVPAGENTHTHTHTR